MSIYYVSIYLKNIHINFENDCNLEAQKDDSNRLENEEQSNWNVCIVTYEIILVVRLSLSSAFALLNVLVT